MEVILVLTPLLLFFAIIGFIYPTPLHKKIVIGKIDFGKKLEFGSFFIKLFFNDYFFTCYKR